MSKAEWNAKNPDRQKVYSAIYRAKKKGVEPAPELLAKVAEWKAEKEAERQAKKGAKRDRKEQDRLYRARPEVQARVAERKRERYQNDPEYREKMLARNRQRYAGTKEELTPERKAEWDRLRLEGLAKGRKIANARRVAEAIAKEEERKRLAAERKAAQATMPKSAPPPKPKHFHRKPGRLAALMGWRGY